MKSSSILRNFKFYLIFLFTQINIAYSMDMAITIDDLPVHANLPPGVTRIDVTKQMTAAFKKHHINHAYGFVIGSRVIDEDEGIPSQLLRTIHTFLTDEESAHWTVLQKWVNNDQLLGNHTFSHLDLAKVTADRYIADIKKNEPILAHVMGNKDYKYFRYPFLSEGDTFEKRNRVRDFLFKNHYVVAETTMGFSDYKWNMAYVRCTLKNDKNTIEWLKKSFITHAMNNAQASHIIAQSLFHRDVKNVLLLHFGAFEAMMMDDLLTAYEKQGVRFISLPEALSDPIYKINPNIVYPVGLDFLAQIRISQNVRTPTAARQTADALPLKQLDSLCQSLF